MQQEKVAWGLLRRRQLVVPTWRGWLVFLLLAGVCGVLIGRKTYSFLAVTDSKPGGYLVVEGWAPDYVLQQAIGEFNHQTYQKLFTIGGPIEHGAPLSEFKTYAEMAAATLAKMGADTNRLQAAPAPLVRQDRTYAAAVALKKWLIEHNLPATNINVLSVGPHGRRSRLMFEKAFGKDAEVGIISVAPFEYNQSDWWRSSPGVRGVTSEFLAYLYARIIFHPSKDP